MKILPFLLGALCAVSSFAMDEYLAIPEGALEIRGDGTMFEYTGYYDDAGTRHDYDEIFSGSSFSPVFWSGRAQVKYGLAPGIDVEATWAAAVYEDENQNPKGMLAPTFGFKVTPPGLGVGLFVMVIPPLATGDFDDGNQSASFQGGALIRQQADVLRFTGSLSFTTNLDRDAGILSFLAKPEFLLSPNLGLILGVRGENQFFSNEYRVILLAPGFYAEPAPGLVVEFSAPFTVAGRRASSGWGAEISAGMRILP
jgi:hypothetical protein